VLRSAARDARRGRARDAEVRAAELAVRLVLPTGVALLPAFVALGIVPTVISLLGGTLALTAPGA
jgi:tight adherence protein B